MKLFYPASVCLPDFNRIDGEKWATIACDQFTSEPEYWQACDRFVGNAPSALRLILPEVYLQNDIKERIDKINKTMLSYQNTVLSPTNPCFILVERTQPDGRVRTGLLGCIDLQDYSFSPEAKTPIRSTEGTVAERIPPRVAIRENALYELPHVMLLIDDPHQTVIEPLTNRTNFKTLYDFPLMLGGGHIRGRLIRGEEAEVLNEKLLALCDKNAANPLLFAVGDGNHSLATAKTIYEKLKAKDCKLAETSPARYALTELVNLHSPALDFEPIYRLVTGLSEPNTLIKALSDYATACASDPKCTAYPKQTVTCITADGEVTVLFMHGSHSLSVGTVQKFLDERKTLSIDYIHDESSLRRLASQKGALGILFDGMKKSELFSAVQTDGPLPRKTFSMGHACDKRYYIEARVIR